MKNKKYAIRLLKIAENNPICQIIPNIYSLKFENIGFDTSLWKNKYAEWNEDEKPTNKRNPSQLICVLHSVSDIVHKTDKFEQTNNFIKPWKQSCKIEFQIEKSKETPKSSYYSTLSKIQFMNSDISRILLYTDGSKVNLQLLLSYLRQLCENGTILSIISITLSKKISLLNIIQF